jgi:hypothetical protein
MANDRKGYLAALFGCPPIVRARLKGLLMQDPLPFNRHNYDKKGKITLDSPVTGGFILFYK